MDEIQYRYSKIVNRERRQCEMLLYGVIGEQVNGHTFAQELNYLSAENDEIKIRINSEGGSVIEGLSIISAMMGSNAYIHAHVDGVAASMAAVILAAADRVTMNDYAKVMVHSPYYTDEAGNAEKQLTAKDRKGLSMLKNTLVQLLKKRGIDDDSITSMMRTDTWFTSDEAMTAKLVDEVVATGRKKELSNLTIKKLVAKISNEIVKSDQFSMKKVIAQLNLLGAGLEETATEDQVTAAIDKVVKPAKPTPAAAPQKLVDKLLAIGKAIGTITDKNEAAYNTLAATNIDLFVDMLDLDSLGETNTAAMPKAVPETGRLSDAIAAIKKGNPGAPAPDEKTFEWYEKNNPQALAKMEVNDPEKFKKLKEADEAKYAE